MFTSAKKPTGTVQGTAYVFDNDDRTLPVIIEGTVTPIANGGTGQSSLAGAQSALGITALSEQIANKPSFYLNNFALTNGTAKVVNLEASHTYLMFASRSDVCGLWIINTTSTNAVAVISIGTAPANMTITAGTGTVSILASASGYHASIIG